MAQLDTAPSLAFESRPVTRIGIEGRRVTREYVITREIETKVGEPFRLATLEADLQRLENLGLFAETSVVPASDGDGVALTFTFKEMPPIIPFPSFLYTEENGFSYGAALSAMNLTGRGISLSARAYFGGTTQRWARLSYPWIGGNHRSFDFFGGQRERFDTMNGFNEESWEFAPGGRHLARPPREAPGGAVALQDAERRGGQDPRPGQRGRVRAPLRDLGYDTRDSWRSPSEAGRTSWR